MIKTEIIRLPRRIRDQHSGYQCSCCGSDTRYFESTDFKDKVVRYRIGCINRDCSKTTSWEETKDIARLEWEINWGVRK